MEQGGGTPGSPFPIMVKPQSRLDLLSLTAAWSSQLDRGETAPPDSLAVGLSESPNRVTPATWEPDSPEVSHITSFSTLKNILTPPSDSENTPCDFDATSSHAKFYKLALPQSLGSRARNAFKSGNEKALPRLLSRPSVWTTRVSSSFHQWHGPDAALARPTPRRGVGLDSHPHLALMEESGAIETFFGLKLTSETIPTSRVCSFGTTESNTGVEARDHTQVPVETSFHVESRIGDKHITSSTANASLNLPNAVADHTLVNENQQLRWSVNEKDEVILKLQNHITKLEHQVRDLRQKLPVGGGNKISQIPIETMLQIMREYGSEVSQATLAVPRKSKVQPASVIRQFRRWNPNFFEHFRYADGEWLPKLGRTGELARRAEARAMYEANLGVQSSSSGSTTSSSAASRAGTKHPKRNRGKGSHNS